MSQLRRCDGCLEIGDRPALKWSLSSPGRGQGKPPRFFDFCSDECLRDFAIDGIEERARRQEERRRLEAAEAGHPPASPCDMPPVSPARVAS